MMLYGWLGHIENARDCFVALPLHHQGKHFHLTLGETEIGRRDPVPRTNVPILRRGATEGFGWNVDASCKY